MPRAFLCWIAALCAVSWVGITLVELGSFSAALAAAAGIVAAGMVSTLVPAERKGMRGDGLLLPAVALLLCATLLPAIDTTLLSQDASIYASAGRWLARTGSLEIPDPSLETMTEQERLALFSGGSITPRRFSLVRLPGGVVLPDLDETSAYPSFSHLLSVWIAVAEGIGGPRASAALGPLFAFTAWWAIGIVALRDAGRLAALAAIALLASFLPEHWFARFLMPGILTQALVWGGVAASRLAGDERSTLGTGARRTAAVLSGAALGIAAFARLEQFWVFVPALLLVRALLPAGRSVLPRGALLPFALMAGQAALHLVLLPTDYGNRIYKAYLEIFWHMTLALSELTGHDGYMTGFLLRWALPALVLVLAAGLLWLGMRLERRSSGSLVRVISAALALPWLVALYRRGMPDEFSVLSSLGWYVPWPVWGAALLGLPSFLTLPGLDLALALEAIDQVTMGRVSPEHIWASRRLVVIVLPIVALAAARALARLPSGGGRWRPVVAGILIAAGILIGGGRLSPVLGRPLQGGARELVGEVADALPRNATVVLAASLDWAHIAAALWLEHDRRTLVMRAPGYPGYEEALEKYLRGCAAQPLYFLAGAVVDPGDEPRYDEQLARIPETFSAEQVASFRSRITMLEATHDRRPEAILERQAVLRLYRLRLNDSVRGATSSR